jgi:hypothetical protein
MTLHISIKSILSAENPVYKGSHFLSGLKFLCHSILMINLLQLKINEQQL